MRTTTVFVFALLAVLSVAFALPAAAPKAETLTVPPVPVQPLRAHRPGTGPSPAAAAKGDLKGSESYYWPGYYGGYPYAYGYGYPYAYGYYPYGYYLG